MAKDRDPADVVLMLKLIHKQWDDLRVGQILIGALGCKPEELSQRLFYIENDELRAKLVEYMKRK